MAKLRQASAYRRIKRPYTRISRVKAKAFIKGEPHMKITLYDSGATNRVFPCEVQLVAQQERQIRDNALEAARIAATRILELTAGKLNWGMKFRVVPHQILRENPVATGAGADRFSSGMAQSYGKPIGHAAQVRAGKVLISFYVNKEHVPVAKEAARKAKSKFGMRCTIEEKPAVSSA